MFVLVYERRNERQYWLSNGITDAREVKKGRDNKLVVRFYTSSSSSSSSSSSRRPGAMPRSVKFLLGTSSGSFQETRINDPATGWGTVALLDVLNDVNQV